MGQRLMDEKQAELLDKLNGERTRFLRAKELIGNLLAVCDLVQPTLEEKGRGAYYFKFKAEELRTMLDSRDTDLYQASRILSLLSDKIADLDSLLGSAKRTLDSSIDYLKVTASSKKRGSYKNE